MQSKAKTVAEYLKLLDPERREMIEAVRKVILANLDSEYEEGMSYGMIGYYVPHSVYPPGYHCDPKLPLPMGGLASQKNHCSVYLMTTYADGTPEEQWFRKAWAKTGKKLDMGKCCIRFRRIEDVALNVIGEAIRRVPARKFIAMYEAARAEGGGFGGKRKSPAKRGAAPKAKSGGAKRGNTTTTKAPKFKVAGPKR